MAALSDSDDSDDDLFKACGPRLTKKQIRKEQQTERQASALMAKALKDADKYREYHQRKHEQQDVGGARMLSEAERQQRIEEINKPATTNTISVLDSKFGVPDLHELAGEANFGVRATFGSNAVTLPFDTEKDALRALDKILRRTSSIYSADKAVKMARAMLGNLDLVLGKLSNLVVELSQTISAELCEWLFHAALISDETSDLPQSALVAFEELLEDGGENIEMTLNMNLGKQLKEWFGFELTTTSERRAEIKVGHRPIDKAVSSLQRWIRLWDCLVRSSGCYSHQQPTCIVCLFRLGLDPVAHINCDDWGKNPSISNLPSLLCVLVVQLKTTDEYEEALDSLMGECRNLGPGEVGKDADDENGLMALRLLGDLFRWRNTEKSISVQACFDFRSMLSKRILRHCLCVSEQVWSKAVEKVVAAMSSWLTGEIARLKPWSCLVQVLVAFELFDVDRITEDSAGCLAAIECIILNVYETGMNYFYSSDSMEIYGSQDQARRVAEYLAVVEAKAEKMRQPFARYAATCPHAGRAEYRLAVFKKQCRFHHVRACAAAGYESPTKVIQRTMDAFLISQKKDEEEVNAEDEDDDDDGPMDV